jgi:ferrochelatase
MSYDALLVLSFGGPEWPEDVLPFLRTVTRGREVPEERLAVVAEQYHLFGGRSPINDHNRALVTLLEAELTAAKIDLAVYWGNRNWHPFVTETVATMAEDGITNALVFVTSAFGSYPGCRQYREDLERAAAGVGPSAPALTKLRLFYNHPGFIEPLAENLRSSLEATERRIVFTAHSIPDSMASSCDYERQLREAAELVMVEAGLTGVDFDLVYQSRSGPPGAPWLEPDINDHLEALHNEGVSAVTIVPLGFISDHMEVVFDLDTQARATAERLGIAYDRVPTIGNHARFVTMIRQLIDERFHDRPGLTLGGNGTWPNECPVDHCLPPRRPA